MEYNLSEKEKSILLQTARERITSSLEKRKPVYSDPTQNLLIPCGAFVTLQKQKALRGCIGHITGTAPLFDTIKDISYSSGFQDPRFSPLSLSELNDIDIEISVLSPMKKISSIEEIETGTHGLYIIKSGRSGVLLPQVPVEQQWDRDTFLTHTCYKAGLDGECWKDPTTEIFIFSAIIFGEK